MTERCGQVEPFWVRLGSIKWAGSPTPEPNYMIEYRRCTSTETSRHTDVHGFTGHLCTHHLKERT